jgi:hypothetical protein
VKLVKVKGGWIRMRETSVHHWRFEDGVPKKVLPSVVYPDGLMSASPKGWYCWVYPRDDKEFEKWMNTSCPNAEYIHRFNSGDPMYTVYIKKDKEAVLFQLKWM